MSEQFKHPVCAICPKPVVKEYRPFCSERCADLDLHRWLNGSYVIAGEEDESASISDLTEGAQENTQIH